MINVSMLWLGCFAFLVSGMLAFSETKATPEEEGRGEREVVETVYYGKDGSIVARFEGGAPEDDEKLEGKPFVKRVETRRYFGEDGKPAIIEDGYSIERKIFEKKKDEDSELTSSFFDVADKPCMSVPARFSTMKVENMPEKAVVSFYDEKGVPCVPKVLFKVARMEMIWEKSNPLLEEDKYFGVGCKGNFELRSFGVDGKPMLDTNGVARTVAKVNPDGSQTILYYGVNGEPKAFMNRFEKVVTWYGKDRNVREVQSQSADGKLKDVPFGAYRFSTVKTDGDTVRLYNASGKEVKAFTTEEFRQAWEDFLASDNDTDYREKEAE